MKYQLVTNGTNYGVKEIATGRVAPHGSLESATSSLDFCNEQDFFHKLSYHSKPKTFKPVKNETTTNP